MCVSCICWRPSLNLLTLIQAERRAKVNSSAGLMRGDKDDSQMESVNCSQAMTTIDGPSFLNLIMVYLTLDS